MALDIKTGETHNAETNTFSVYVKYQDNTDSKFDGLCSWTSEDDGLIHFFVPGCKSASIVIPTAGVKLFMFFQEKKVKQSEEKAHDVNNAEIQIEV